MIGIVLGVVTILAILIALAQFFSRRSEAEDAEYLRDRLLEAANDLNEARAASDFWRGNAREQARQLTNAHGDLEIARTEVEELEGALRLACADLADAEDAIEELEEESDEFEESAKEATEGWQASVNLAARAIAWAERVHEAAEERTPL